MKLRDILSQFSEEDRETIESYMEEKDSLASAELPEDYAAYIRDMQDSFAMLDTAISDISSLVEDSSIDSTRVKAIFYSLFFGAENLQMDSSDYRAFADCFVTIYAHCSKIFVAEG